MIVAAHGDQRKKLEQDATIWAFATLEFTGKVRQEQMAELYDRADVYLNAPKHGQYARVDIRVALPPGCPW